MRHSTIFKIALLALLLTATAAIAIPFDPDSVEDVRGQKRYTYRYDHGDYSELDSLNLATHYTQTGREGELFAFENSAGGDTIFTLLTTDEETLHVGKVDTVYGEGTWDDTAWRVIMNGVMQEGLPKIRTITEEWAFDFLTLLDADTSYHDLGDESFHNIYYDGTGDEVRWTAWVYPGILTWNLIELSIQEMQNHPLPADNKILAFPNPFNSAVTISVEQTFLSVQNGQTGMSDLPVQVEIFDVNGRRISVIPDPDRESSRAAKDLDSRFHGNDRTVIWQPAPSLPSGVYLVRASVGDQTTSKRMVYLK